MQPAEPSKQLIVEPSRSRVVGAGAGGELPARASSIDSGPWWWRAVPTFESPRCSVAGRVAGCGCSVGACGSARKPLAALGLGLTAALRVRFARVVGAGVPPCQPHDRP
jgi:hypothetical protein